MPYAVVIFTDENSVECVPSSWIQRDCCFWPPKFAKALVKKQSQPDSEQWSKFPIRRIGHDYETLEEAKKVCNKAEETSNVESDNSESRKRKSKAPSRLIESDADNEAEEETPRRADKVNKKLPPPPEGYGLGQSGPRIDTGPVQLPPVSDTLPVISRLRSPDLTDTSFQEPATIGHSEDGTPFQKILDKLEAIEKDVSQIKRMILLESTNEDEEETFLPNGQIDNIADLEELENFDELKKRRMVNWLASLQGGEDGGLICRTVMRKLMTNALMSKFSGHGQKGKLKFIGIPIYKIIMHAARKASKKKLSLNQINEEILDVLRNAPYKPGGSQHKKKGRRSSVQEREMAISDVSD